MPSISMNQKQSELSIPYRRNANQFSSSQLKFFYENIVLRCENDEKPLKYFYINSIEIKQLKQKYDFELTHKKKVKGFTITTVPHDNDFVFVDDKHAAITSLLYHTEENEMNMKTMKLCRIAFVMLAAFSLASCSSNEPRYADPEADEKAFFC